MKEDIYDSLELNDLTKRDTPPKFYIEYYKKQGMDEQQISEQFQNEIDELYDDMGLPTDKLIQIAHDVVSAIDENGEVSDILTSEEEKSEEETTPEKEEGENAEEEKEKMGEDIADIPDEKDKKKITVGIVAKDKKDLDKKIKDIQNILKKLI